MKLQDDIDFTTLNWVKQELDETLKQARQALEAYVEDTADTSLMRFCATYLHQVQGTLRMVELYGAAMVVEEMERVAQALLDNEIKPQDETYSVLMRGIVQLPDYLERLQSGHKDIPIVLLPLLNDLRATRGEKLLTESVLFSPDLSAPLPTPTSAPAPAMTALELRGEGARLRTAFQLSLLRWIRNESANEQLDRLILVLDRLRAACMHDDARRLWWVAGGVLESVQTGALEANAAVKLLFGKIDREIKRLVDNGEQSFVATPPRELTKNLLYYIAHTATVGPRALEIRNLYKLDTLLPSDRELEHAKGSISGHNRALLDTVSTAIKDDLMRVKEALDIFLRAQENDPADLTAQADILDRVGDTLGMLGLGVPRRVVTEQRKIIQEIASKSRNADETTLLDVAGALLYVEASLDDHIDRLGADEPQHDAPMELELPKAEVRKILDALMKEASVNISQAKHDIVAFIESPWDHARVEQIPRLLEEISGALRMLDLTESARLMTGIVRFVEVELLRHRRVPTVEQMDKLADALASIEYYMEATREQRGGRDQILEVTRQSLQSLGYWPVPDDNDGGSPTPEPPPPERSAPRARDDAGERSPAPSMPPPVEPHRSGDSAHAELAELSANEARAAPADSSSSLGLTEAELAKIEASGSMSGFPDWGDHLPTGVETGFKFEGDASSGNASNDAQNLPSIELPDESIDAYLARLNLVEDGSETPFESPLSDSGRTLEVNSGIEIAPGNGLEDLIIGETRAHDLPALNMDGLKLAETGAAAPAVRYIEIEEEIEEEVPEDDGAPSVADASFHISASDEIDAEIREVFVEEVQEEIENLNRNLPLWQSDVSDFERLKPIRRSFHTLKGSGRLVGALALGDFSWKVENMLNRVLDKTILASAAVQALCGQAIGVLPELLAALRGEGAPKSDISAIMGAAEKLAAGEETWVRATPPKRMKKVRRTIRRMVAVAEEVVPQVELPSAPIALHDVVDITAPAYEEPTHAFVDTTHFANELPSIDPVLYEILTSEVSAHLGVIDAYITDAQISSPMVAVSEALLRAVHTLNGAIAMVEIPVISQVLAPLEGYIKCLRAANEAPSAEGLTALTDASSLTRAVMAAIDRGDAQLPDASELVERITRLRDAFPEPQLMHVLFSESGDAESRAVSVADAGTHAPVETAAETSGAQVEMDDSAALMAALEALEQPATEAVVETSHSHVLSLDDSGPDADTIVLGSSDGSEADLTAAWVEQQLQQQNQADEKAAADAAQIVAAQERAAQHAAAEQAAAEQAEAEKLAAAQLAAKAAELEALDQRETLTREDDFEDAQVHDVASQTTPEPEPEVAIPVALAVAEPEAFAGQPMIELPPLQDDPQPDGKLELQEMDEDLLEIFVQEGADILDHSDSLMARLRLAPQDREMVTGLQRDLHTLKGGARMAGLAPIGDLSHAMESLLDAISDNRRVMDRMTVESLERGFDRLHGLVQRVSRRQAIAMPAFAIERFEGLVSGDLPMAAPAPVQTETAPDPSATTTSQAPVAAPAPVAKPARAPRPLPRFEEEEVQPRAPQEMIRVRSDLLDSLVNYAGEVSIYRSRLEQQISTFRFNLVEFETTVSRLRDQLRKLEMETEAQILSRYQREAESNESAFDPLELDRFSQLQQLSRALAESVSDLDSIQGLLDDLTRQSETLLLQQSRVSSDLQEGLMRTRMVPFDSLVPSLRRTLRQAAQEIGKRAQLKVEGAQGEMDRNLLERMKAPFEHMLRNALAHGIEPPEERLKAGKPAEGAVGIAVSREATEVVLRVSDDGRGLDRDAIRRKAIERGLLKPDAQLSDRDLYGFIVETGFSTAETVTQLSGRGVGMDVVHNEIKQLGGSLVIDSTHGVGTTFIIRLPFTLAVTQAILVRLGEATYAVPMSSVQGVVRIARNDLEKRMATVDPTYAYAGDEFRIYELSQLLNIPAARMSDEAQLPLLMTRTGDQRAAVRIDAVIGSREIVVKSVGPQISSVPGIFGATIMGDGSVVMILDLAPLVRRSAALRESSEAGSDMVIEAPAPPMQPPIPERRRQPLIMVVDDSITMRKVTTRVLERNDMEVVTAKDGLDAVEKLQDKVPDVVLLDVEMPRMDGYELATYMKNDPRLKLVPIIMITSRTGEKHRQRALEIGVERYLGKPYQEADLLRNLQETLRLTRA